jgi:hypothetical protein
MQQQYLIDMAGLTGLAPASQLIHLPMQQAAAVAQRSLVNSLRRNTTCTANPTKLNMNTAAKSVLLKP